MVQKKLIKHIKLLYYIIFFPICKASLMLSGSLVLWVSGKARANNPDDEAIAPNIIKGSDVEIVAWNIYNLN